ncbi:MAG: hypothetical protein IPG45_00915 [Deltaproteobacteria bacterium]|nr:hypothetical protein [Deltaproteobacteria bacterium]
MRGLGWKALGLLGASAMGVACQRNVAITAPPAVDEGSLWVVGRGDGSRGSTFVHATAPGERVQVGPVAFNESLELHAFHQRCTLPEIFDAAGSPVVSGELQLNSEPRAGHVLPAPLRTYGSLLDANGQADWSEAATIPDTALSTLNLAPLPNDHGCLMGVSALEHETRFLKDLGRRGTILHPAVFAAVGPEDALIALNYARDFRDVDRVGQGIFRFPVDALEGSQLIPIREVDTASQGYFGGVVLGQEAWLHRSGHLDRLDLSSDPWRFEGEVTDPFTTDFNLNRIEYVSLLAGSKSGEVPEILMLSARREIDSLGNAAEDRPTLLRGFDPVNRSWTVYFDEVVEVRGPVDESRFKEISMQRVGPGEAVMIGLDGDNTHLFHLRDGAISAITPPSSVTKFGDLVRVYRPPTVGTVAMTREGAVFHVDLERETWTLLREPYREDSLAARRGDIAAIWGTGLTPEGFMLIGPRPGQGFQAILYRPGLGFCGGQEVGLSGLTRNIQLPDRQLAVISSNGANTIEVREGRLRRGPLDCAAPSGM